MTACAKKRLPGFRFETQPSRLPEVLPRMDIAVFVGFAASGPLHTPVPIDSVPQFVEIFGEDLPLAWDEARAEQHDAYLAPAVRTFFRNGGRRCWIVRVAAQQPTKDLPNNQARANFFPVPGLAQLDNGQITPVMLSARSEGSWSDGLRVSATLQSQPIAEVAIPMVSNDSIQLELPIGSLKSYAQHDFIRLTFSDSGIQVMFSVDSIQEKSITSPDQTPKIIIKSRKPAVWFRESWRMLPINLNGCAYSFQAGIKSAPMTAVLVPPEANNKMPASPLTLADLAATLKDQLIKVNLQTSFQQAPEPGSLVQIDFMTEQLWLLVHEVNAVSESGSPPCEMVQLGGKAVWWLKEPPDPGILSQPVSAEKLSLELWVRQGAMKLFRLADLSFSPTHPRFIDSLPSDLVLYVDDTAAIARGDRDTGQKLNSVDHRTLKSLWTEVSNPRFPLAGFSTPKEAIYFPIAMAFTPQFYLGAAPHPADVTPLERDGLAELSPWLFLDPDLIESRTDSLMDQADFTRYTSPAARKLVGIHAALGIEEATLIAVPDADQRGWEKTDPETPKPAASMEPLPHPEWWHFLECNPPAEIPLSSEPKWENFLNYDVEKISSPDILATTPDGFGSFKLSWTEIPEASYILEESTFPDFKVASIIFSGSDTQMEVYGRSKGSYYYHVRAIKGSATSDWSQGIDVSVSAGLTWQLLATDKYKSDTLLIIHRAVLRLAAARGDLLAVLTLPEHFRAQEAMDYVTQLKSPYAKPISVDYDSLYNRLEKLCFPLSSGESRAFSHAAVYHPWVITPVDGPQNEFRRIPADGIVCGLLARRALARGAWIAPANEILSGIISLTPTIASEYEQSIQQMQINLLRQEPPGFTVLGAETLSDDPDLQPINVRRLLCLLRRLALREGETYVFEPNSSVFRRTLQRGFESWLDYMFERGAFAGATPATSYQVVIDSAFNRQESLDLGRLIVELRVAPSLPMTFMTIRLQQTNDRRLVIEER